MTMSSPAHSQSTKVTLTQYESDEIRTCHKSARNTHDINAFDLLVTPRVVNLLLGMFVVVGAFHHGRPLLGVGKSQRSFCVLILQNLRSTLLSHHVIIRPNDVLNALYGSSSLCQPKESFTGTILAYEMLRLVWRLEAKVASSQISLAFAHPYAREKCVSLFLREASFACNGQLGSRAMGWVVGSWANYYPFCNPNSNKKNEERRKFFKKNRKKYKSEER